MLRAFSDLLISVLHNFEIEQNVRGRQIVDFAQVMKLRQLEFGILGRVFAGGGGGRVNHYLKMDLQWSDEMDS